jgi:hypothetical protein
LFDSSAFFLRSPEASLVHNMCTGSIPRMGRSRQRSGRRGRVGQVSYYQHHGGWWASL